MIVRGLLLLSTLLLACHSTAPTPFKPHSLTGPADAAPILNCPCAMDPLTYACDFVGWHGCTTAPSDTNCFNVAGCQPQPFTAAH